LQRRIREKILDEIDGLRKENIIIMKKLIHSCLLLPKFRNIARSNEILSWGGVVVLF
jgi:hypothetical protein